MLVLLCMAWPLILAPGVFFPGAPRLYSMLSVHITVTQLLQPVEFCSDVFLLPLGSPPQDTLDSPDSDEEDCGPPLPPSPPPLDPALYEMLLQSLDNNNAPPLPRPKHSKARAKWEDDAVEHFI